MLFTMNFLKGFQKNKYVNLLPNFREQKTQEISTAIITIILVFLFGLFAMLPTISSINQLRQEKDNDQALKNQLQQKIDNLSILQQKYNSLQGSLPDILASVPQKADMPLLEAQLQSLEKTSNLDLASLQSTQTDSAATSQNAQSFEVSFSANGNYQDILNFLANTLKMQRIITPESISINKNLENNQKLQFVFKAKAYFKP